MSSDRPLKALVPGGSSSSILPANLNLQKTANGEDLMTYESLSDGGLQQDRCEMGGFIVYNDTSCIVRNTEFLLVLSP
jgi:NADH-quinone oxidoreductase subunit F